MCEVWCLCEYFGDGVDCDIDGGFGWIVVDFVIDCWECD